MNSCRFYHSIQVRHDDIDPFQHVNNARFVTYLGLARLAYFEHLGLWDGVCYPELGFVIADLHIRFQQSILPGKVIEVGVRVSQIGNKSLHLEQHIKAPDSEEVYATAEVVLVSYDFSTQASVAISDNKRQVISHFEGLE